MVESKTTHRLHHLQPKLHLEELKPLINEDAIIDIQPEEKQMKKESSRTQLRSKKVKHESSYDMDDHTSLFFLSLFPADPGWYGIKALYNKH
jgi:hypothetical protein